MSTSNYYDLLEIPQSASKEQIRKAYRTKAKQYHPDMNLQSNSHMHFLILTQAYETLMDANKRHLYNMAMISNSEHLLTYEQWREIERRKEKEQEELEHKEFLKRRTNFQQSIYFKPAKIALVVAPIIMYLIGVSIIVVCMWLMWIYHPMLLFIFLPFLSFSIYILVATPKWLSSAKKYF